MPTLPIPEDGLALFGNDVPVSGGSDVVNQMGAIHKRPTVATVRDALAEAIARIHIEYQSEVSQALAQVDPLRATGDFLNIIALEHSVIPAPGEDPEMLRARIFSAPTIVTPQAITDTVNAILAGYTTKQCQISEPDLDGWFATDGVSGVFNGGYVTLASSLATATTSINPDYPDRFYVDNADANEGFFLENNLPGMRVYDGLQPRTFFLRIPDLSPADNNFIFLIQDDAQYAFISDGSDNWLTTGQRIPFSFEDNQTAEELYAFIVGAVEAIKGQGIVWTLLVDPTL